MADQLIFSHPAINGSLKVPINPNQIEWSYGLNTVNYPTYGGEVIQILSCFIDDMTVTGNVRTYRQMEDIYRWFIDYIQLATQGLKGAGKFNIHPVSMFYRPRGWNFQIYPTQMPGFRYGRDVVTPEWTMQAAVVDPDQNLQEKIMNRAQIQASYGDLQLFGKATANIGFEPDDPFRTPDVQNANKDKKLKKGNTSRYDYGKLADWYNNLIPSYLDNNFDDLTADYSKPTFLKGVNKGTADAKKTVDKAKAKGK